MIVLYIYEQYWCDNYVTVNNNARVSVQRTCSYKIYRLINLAQSMLSYKGMHNHNCVLQRRTGRGSGLTVTDNALSVSGSMLNECNKDGEHLLM